MADADARARPETIWLNARLATLRRRSPGLGAIERGALAARDGRIVFVGAAGRSAGRLARRRANDRLRRPLDHARPDRLPHPSRLRRRPRRTNSSCGSPARATRTIARAGGGIVSTVAATRAASEDELVRQSLPRLDALIAEGVTTVEIKSGYGLDLAAERESLRAARRLGQRAPGHGANHLPRRPRPAAGIRRRPRRPISTHVVDEMLPALAARRAGRRGRRVLRDASPSRRDEIARVFDAARALGLPVKLHADQLSNLRGAALAAEFGALSADHLEHTDEDGVAAMATAGTVAVLLPGAYYFAARDAGAADRRCSASTACAMAVATDCNPGTSPLTSLLLAHEHGGDAVPPDRRRMPRRRHPRRRARARARAPRPARWKPANGPIWRSGTSSARPSSSTASASTRCMRASGGADDASCSIPAQRRSPIGARSIAARAPRSIPPAAAGVDARARRRSARIVATRRAGLWHQHRLRQAGERAHRRRRSRDAAAQHRAVARRRRRRADAGRRSRG